MNKRFVSPHVRGVKNNCRNNAIFFLNLPTSSETMRCETVIHLNDGSFANILLSASL